MFRDRDFDSAKTPPWNAQALVADLDLRAIVAAMAQGDSFLASVAESALLESLTDLETILYRQAVLKDCIEREAVVRELYELAVETLNAERKSFWFGTLARHPGSVLYRADELLHMLLGKLRQLRTIADASLPSFESEGFTTLFAMLRKELSGDYLAAVAEHLQTLKFERGVLASWRLGQGNKGVECVLHRDAKRQAGWLARAFGVVRGGARFYQLSPRDESGARALRELRDMAINAVANAGAQSADHILAFFALLRVELAFYLGCVNLRKRLLQLGMPIAFPEPLHQMDRRHDAAGLYDASLALNAKASVVANDLHGGSRATFIITGANRGGKSTFLRAVGLAQVMMQCGMFVSAEHLCANACGGIFTHYKREEDPTMRSGKLDEELSRMDEIVEHVVPNALILFNESFAATNEREGSAIAGQIVTALAEARTKIFFVTHLYEFASAMRSASPAVAFLRAERLHDGERSFKIVEGAPLETSYGRDLYGSIFGGETNGS